MADQARKRLKFGIGPYRYTWDGEVGMYVVECDMDVSDHGLEWVHPIATQGVTMNGARVAMDSAIELTIKNWPPRKS